MNFESLSDQLRNYLENQGIFGDKMHLLHLIIGFVSLAAISYLIWFITRWIIIGVVRFTVTRTKVGWDDQLFNYKVFRTLALIFIVVMIAIAVPAVFRDYPKLENLARMTSRIYIVLSIMFAVNAILNASVGILESNEKYRDKPLRSYTIVSESFKNWRGMEESDGRRIKHPLNIKISAVRAVVGSSLISDTIFHCKNGRLKF